MDFKAQDPLNIPRHGRPRAIGRALVCALVAAGSCQTCRINGVPGGWPHAALIQQVALALMVGCIVYSLRKTGTAIDRRSRQITRWWRSCGMRFRRSLPLEQMQAVGLYRRDYAWSEIALLPRDLGVPIIVTAYFTASEQANARECAQEMADYAGLAFYDLTFPVEPSDPIDLWREGSSKALGRALLCGLTAVVFRINSSWPYSSAVQAAAMILMIVAILYSMRTVRTTFDPKARQVTRWWTCCGLHVKRTKPLDHVHYVGFFSHPEYNSDSQLFWHEIAVFWRNSNRPTIITAFRGHSPRERATQMGHALARQVGVEFHDLSEDPSIKRFLLVVGGFAAFVIAVVLIDWLRRKLWNGPL